MMTLLIVFICHNNETVTDVRTKYPDATICFVGSSEILQEYQEDSKIIIVRDLAINIEDRPKFLTFTAWYAISKNGLFKEYDYLAIFEYDVVLEEGFDTKLREKCILENPDVVSFLKIERYFFWDIHPKLFYHFLDEKKKKYDICNKWYPTTNHCMKRKVLDDFVNWYYPGCIDFWVLDRKMVSWYHERFFSVFIKVYDQKWSMGEGLEHIQIGSHGAINTQKEKSISLEIMDLYYQNPNNVETLEKIETVYSELT
jgi:hypothetical protein